MKKRILILLSVLSIFPSATALAGNACVVMPATSVETTDAVMPLSDVIVWKYKTIGNGLYRRKYNVTTKQYIGEWELMS